MDGPAAGAAPFKKRRQHPDVVVPDPTKPMHGFDAEAAGFSYEDMCTAVAVLAAVGKNLELFDSRALKPLRVAVMPLGEHQTKKVRCACMLKCDRAKALFVCVYSCIEVLQRKSTCCEKIL
jgi:hypothetical protein